MVIYHQVYETFLRWLMVISLIAISASLPTHMDSDQPALMKLPESDNMNVSYHAPSLLHYQMLDGHLPDRTNSGSVKLKACCNDNCLTFENLINMVGIECCGDKPASIIKNICCKGELHDRRNGYRYFDRCCGTKPYAADQTCCSGKVHDGIGLACCGEAAYDLHSKKKICCEQQLYTVPDNFVTTACCGNMLYNAWDGSEFCCGSKVYSREKSNACCVSELYEEERQYAKGYNTEKELCCNGVHDKRFFDTCCYVSDPSNGNWKALIPIPYNSRTHCCDFTGVTPIDPSTGKCNSS
ncbi:hypothetical protein M514_11720 [Trichuris suis]|uniref:Galaxin-like repeats domain-containing protein n=1 Tax=Trichuris suis TaxID=68888 RepID=A0A085LR13_9BILA|nr:hypothetical protein M513_11720 [Trichuris suis]KFD63040.1 hypothetical protein M514_11720 [Trichuris suis]